MIDPEFCFLGEPAFDLGVLLAHLHLSDESARLRERAIDAYRGSERTQTLARAFAGVEIMRRLIGVAQLPLSHGLDEKRELLELSRKLVLAA